MTGGMDMRHRWEVTERKGARVTHTCRACGRTYVHESFIPDSVFEALVTQLLRPNPYRRMLKA